MIPLSIYAKKSKSIIITPGDLFGSYLRLSPSAIWLVLPWTVTYIGGSAGAKARCLLDRGVHHLECPLFEVPLYLRIITTILTNTSMSINIYQKTSATSAYIWSNGIVAVLWTFVSPHSALIDVYIYQQNNFSTVFQASCYLCSLAHPFSAYSLCDNHICRSRWC